MNIRYSAKAVVSGGRQGHGRSSDGRLDVKPSVPATIGGDGGPGTNPQQLFVVAYAACFHTTLLTMAKGRSLGVSGSTITAHVGIGPTGQGGLGLAVALGVRAPRFARRVAELLTVLAHARHRHANATPGNAEVTLATDGQALEQPAA